jgi:hypothetical protein
MTKDEVLKLALEALEQLQGGCTDSDDGTIEAITVWCPEVINAIKEALAQSEQESDDLTIAYMSGFHDGKNKCTPQPEQEPVAMRYDFDGYGWLYIDNGSGSNWREKIKNAEPLYTAPPQRKWVGLTVKEIEWCFYDANDARIVAARSIEAKLKQKNGFAEEKNGG